MIEPTPAPRPTPAPEIRDWMLPANMRPSYVPPVVREGIVSASTFWKMAVANCERNLADPRGQGNVQFYLEHALKMLKAALAAEARRSHG